MTGDLIAIGALLSLLGLSGLFSGSETALFSLGSGDRHSLRDKKDTVSTCIGILLDNTKRVLLTILIFNNAINIAFFSVASWWAVNTGFSSLSMFINIFALIALLLMGEIIPKVISSSNPLLFARILAVPLYFAFIVARPASTLVEKFLGRWLEDDDQLHHTETVTTDELQLVVEESRRHGTVSDLVHDRLKEVIKLSDTPISKIMTHRVDIPIVESGSSHDEAVAALKENPSAYMLVVDPESEDCVGVLTAQDVLKGGSVAKRMRKPLYIPEAALVPRAIERFQNSSKQYAVVVDEYGGTAGALTLAHIGNALLGEGHHEDVPTLPAPVQINQNKWELSGLTPIDGWEDILGIVKDEDREFTTIGGFISHTLGAIPDKGARLLIGNLLFQVEQTDERFISAISIERLSQDEARRITAIMGTTHA